MEASLIASSDMSDVALTLRKKMQSLHAELTSLMERLNVSETFFLL